MSSNLANAIHFDAGCKTAAATEAEPAHYRTLRASIAKKTAAVAICGMGYVGLPLCRAIIEQGFPVVGLDIDDEKVEKLNAGQSYIRHIPPTNIQAMLKTGRFRASSDFSQIANADIIAVCVPTPLNRHREPDLSFVTVTADVIAPFPSSISSPITGNPCSAIARQSGSPTYPMPQTATTALFMAMLAHKMR